MRMYSCMHALQQTGRQREDLPIGGWLSLACTGGGRHTSEDDQAVSLGQVY